jgi:molybdopterin-guanine dinucleotide biosynthesis protein A
MAGSRTERDRVAVDEPLEIRIGGRAVAVTRRTPGHDEELAISFCLSEGCGPRTPRISLRRKTALPVLERRLADGSLALHDALGELDTTRVAVDSVLLANVNTPDELRRLR